MNSYYLKIILLENCSYSIALDKHIKNNNIINKTIWITRSEADKFKTEQIKTFPQIYLNKINSKENILFGGYDDFNDFFYQFKNQELSNDKINYFMTKHIWSKKALLRLIQLINPIN